MGKLFNADKFRKDEFKRVAIDLPEDKKRELEMNLLKPERLPTYSGKTPPLGCSKPVQSRTVKIVFRNDDELALTAKHLGMRNYVESNIKNTDKLVALLMALEEGIICYDEVSKTITLPTVPTPRPRRTR